MRVKKVRKVSLADGKLQPGDIILAIAGVEIFQIPPAQCKPLMQSRVLKMKVQRSTGMANQTLMANQTAIRSIRLSRAEGKVRFFVQESYSD